MGIKLWAYSQFIISVPVSLFLGLNTTNISYLSEFDFFLDFKMDF